MILISSDIKYII